MKNVIMGIAITAIATTGCNNNSKSTTQKTAGNDNTKTDNTAVKTQTPGEGTTNSVVSIKPLIDHYLEMKNALANDNGKEAAAHGTALNLAIEELGKSPLTADQKKIYDDAAIDAKEHSEHIASNGSKIAHQREHFDMLSTDIYDMVKAFGAGTVLYKDYCPMYNNKKGAIWLSGVNEIKNPYYGNKMLTCGIVKEEIK
ncbi:MAG TPA: DUF3347 domain-containing protein [Ferruginibacter sp.]|nr:DUF3347 domain-containing protein [Ferruginibacter sp.]